MIPAARDHGAAGDAGVDLLGAAAEHHRADRHPAVIGLSAARIDDGGDRGAGVDLLIAIVERRVARHAAGHVLIAAVEHGRRDRGPAREHRLVQSVGRVLPAHRDAGGHDFEEFLRAARERQAARHAADDHDLAAALHDGAARNTARGDEFDTAARHDGVLRDAVDDLSTAARDRRGDAAAAPINVLDAPARNARPARHRIDLLVAPAQDDRAARGAGVDLLNPGAQDRARGRAARNVLICA